MPLKMQFYDKLGHRNRYCTTRNGSTLDNDYSPELQRKRAQVRDIMKQLKTKNVRAQCVYPAQIKIYLEAGVKTFPTLMDATLPLRELGIKVRVNERDRQTREISKARWSVQGKGGRGLGTASFVGLGPSSVSTERLNCLKYVDSTLKRIFQLQNVSKLWLKRRRNWFFVLCISLTFFVKNQSPLLFSG